MIKDNNISHRNSLLIYDADINMREMLKEYLSIKQFDITCATSYLELEQKVSKVHFDVVLLEIGNYNDSGLDTIDFLRKQEKDTPIICLGSSSDKQTILEAYGRGCDDYMVKPISLEILVCHIMAVLRRYEPNIKPNEIIQFNGACYDTVTQTFNGQHLNAKLGQILQLLHSHQNEIVPKKFILAKVWMKDDFYTARSLAVYILNLRKLLAPYDYKILSFSKIGYKLIYTGSNVY